jgi:hypothetical protein
MVVTIWRKPIAGLNRRARTFIDCLHSSVKVAQKMRVISFRERDSCGTWKASCGVRLVVSQRESRSKLQMWERV